MELATKSVVIISGWDVNKQTSSNKQTNKQINNLSPTEIQYNLTSVFFYQVIKQM